MSALKVAKEDTNKIKTLQALAIMLRNKPDEALKYFDEARILALKLNDKMSVGKVYQNIASLYSEIRNSLLNTSIEIFILN